MVTIPPSKADALEGAHHDLSVSQKTTMNAIYILTATHLVQRPHTQYSQHHRVKHWKLVCGWGCGHLYFGSREGADCSHNPVDGILTEPHDLDILGCYESQLCSLLLVGDLHHIV